MTLKSRLSRLQTQAGATAGAPGTPSGRSRLDERLAHVRPSRIQAAPAGQGRRHPPAALAETLKGELIHPGLIRIEAQLPLDGLTSAMRPQPEGHLPLLPGESTPAPAIYIDTETTGLAGGSGTLAFLVGWGRVDRTGFRLTQLLITEFAAEAALLRAFAAALPQEHRLVSYNGKSYDIPLLATRYRMQGHTESVTEMAHLDLLHPVRRLFARHWPDCRLTTLERNLLGFARQDDLPGAEAPQAWFDYLRQGVATNLIRVVEHNRQDILSLAAAHYALAEAVFSPRQYEVDLFGLAKWLTDTDDRRALALLQEHSPSLCNDGKRLLARLLRRHHQWELAVPIWEELAARGCAESIERLAKYHEHVSKDLATAWQYASQLSDSYADAQRRRRLVSKLQRLPAVPHCKAPSAERY